MCQCIGRWKLYSIVIIEISPIEYISDPFECDSYSFFDFNKSQKFNKEYYLRVLDCLREARISVTHFPKHREPEIPRLLYEKLAYLYDLNGDNTNVEHFFAHFLYCSKIIKYLFVNLEKYWEMPLEFPNSHSRRHTKCNIFLFMASNIEYLVLFINYEKWWQSNGRLWILCSSWLVKGNFR